MVIFLDMVHHLLGDVRRPSSTAVASIRVRSAAAFAVALVRVSAAGRVPLVPGLGEQVGQ